MELEELTPPEDEVEKSEHEDDDKESEQEDDDEKNYNFHRSRSKTALVKCGYQGCKAAPMVEQNLERHTVKEHRSKVTKKAGQPTIQSFFSRKRCAEEPDADAQSKKDKSDDEEEEDTPQEVVETGDEEVAGVGDGTTDEVCTASLSKAAVSEISKAVKVAVKEAMEDKMTNKDLGHEDEVKEVKTEHEVMRGIRSVKEIAVKFPEFECHPETKGKELQCVVCSKTFSYSAELEQDFGSEILSEKFRNLKKNLLHHLKTFKHQSKSKEDEALAAKWAKHERRNKAVGVTLGRLVYFGIYKGRPDEDFTSLVYLSAAGGSDVGDINHSYNFVTKFLPHLAAAVRRRMKEMLGKRLEATDCLPPVNLIADKATHQRETRQLVGCVTVNPGGQELLVSLLLGIPKCAGGTGDQLCDSILSTTESYTVPEQVRLKQTHCFKFFSLFGFINEFILISGCGVLRRWRLRPLWSHGEDGEEAGEEDPVHLGPHAQGCLGGHRPEVGQQGMVCQVRVDRGHDFSDRHGSGPRGLGQVVGRVLPDV